MKQLSILDRSPESAIRRSDPKPDPTCKHCRGKGVLHQTHEPGLTEDLPCGCEAPEPVERVLVTGNRDWSDAARVYAELARLQPKVIIHGAYDRGADEHAGRAVRRLGVTEEAYPVDPSIDGPWPAAGPRRDARMVKASNAHQALAFGALWRIVFGGMKKRTGTGTTVKMLLDGGIPVRWIETPNANAIDLTTMPKAPKPMVDLGEQAMVRKRLAKKRA